MWGSERQAVALAVATVLIPAGIFAVYGWRWPDGIDDGGTPWYVAPMLALAGVVLVGGCFLQRYLHNAYHRTMIGMLCIISIALGLWLLAEKVGNGDWIAAALYAFYVGCFVGVGLRQRPGAAR
jgi:hypothetical protein